MRLSAVLLLVLLALTVTATVEAMKSPGGGKTHVRAVAQPTG
jgi:hypothetical protein